MDYTKYRIDSGGLWVTYSTPFNLTGYDNGWHTVYYYSVNVDNISETTKSTSVYLDTYVPVTSLRASPGYSVNPYYVKSTSSLTFIRAEVGSGINYTKYRIDDGAWQTYDGAFNLSGYSEDSYTMWFYSVDKLGNRETNRSRTVIVDDTAPTTTLVKRG